MWNFAEKIIPNPNIIRLKREEETLDNIRQFYIICKDKEEKFAALCNLYGCLTIAQTIVFCKVSQLTCLRTPDNNNHYSPKVFPLLISFYCQYCQET